MRTFFLVLLTVLAITLTRADLTLKSRSHSLNEPVNFSTKFEKRQDKAKSKKSEEKEYTWPAIDGYRDEAPPDEMLAVGYLTYATSFIKKNFKINDKDPEKASKNFFEAILKGGYLWRDSCWKLTNASATAAQRTNTLARVVVFPFNNVPSLDIDPIYHLSTTMGLACWERAADGDYNTAVVNHTETLMNQLHWDKEYALKKLEKQHIYFGYTNKTTTHGHPHV